MILAGDIGGTKTVLSLYQTEGTELAQRQTAIYQSREHATFTEVVEAFLATQNPAEPLSAACFGVAGPVVNGRCHTTNLPWLLDEVALAAELKTPRVKLLNDLQATAYGMLFLPTEQMHVLQPGDSQQQPGNIAVIAAGTGLGEAMLEWDGTDYQPLPSEGGHADFAPRSDLEIELLRYLRQKFGHVSYERVLSGPGLANVYDFLRDTGRYSQASEVAAAMSHADRSAVIGQWGLARRDPLCTAALELLLAMYGAEAGNLALRSSAVAVFLGGGIAPKL